MAETLEENDTMKRRIHPAIAGYTAPTAKITRQSRKPAPVKAAAQSGISIQRRPVVRNAASALAAMS